MDLVELRDSRFKVAASLAPRFESSVKGGSATKLLVLRSEGADLLLVPVEVPTRARPVRPERRLRKEDKGLALLWRVALELLVSAADPFEEERIVDVDESGTHLEVVAFSRPLHARVWVTWEHFQ